MVFSASPCEPWDVAACTPWPEGTEAVRDAALMAATEILWNRTMKRFGTCVYSLRPCAEDCAGADALAWLYGSWLPTWGMSSGGFGWPYPALIGGNWYNLGCGSCSGSCSCTELHQVQLPYPVSEVLSVIVDGVELDTSAYLVNDWQYLVRTDGGRWPRCNNLNLPPSEEGTWSVTARYGEEVPALGSFAVNELALQIALACVGQQCGLPSGTVKEIRRQGVSQTLNVGWVDGFMSLPSVNAFIQTYNPANVGGVATIINLDRPRATRWST